MPRLHVGDENGHPVELHHEDVGAGRPVVLIHGWPLSGRSWEAQVGPLVEAGHRVVTYDRRGFGDSSQPWHGYDYDTFTADLHALLEHLDLRDVALVGFSMGGGEVVRYLSRHGTERVSRAVLAAAVPPYLYKSADNPDGGLDDATIEGFQQGVRTDRPAFLDGFTKDFFTPGGSSLLRSPAVSEQQRQYALHLAESASPKGTLDCITAFGRTDFRGDVAAITVPTLVVHGDSDAIVPFEVSGRRSHELIPGSELVVIEGGPHGINASHPEQFNAALIDFLRR
ncbi:Pimeloyl-ACP methyl ester carboxylesterase [Geodermatophilus obscurus]|uniref:Pimeloyl-ACP methyl ester carboxylesterase n=1 Tax=Geodermatophilus obscurus TaxID=1861 RepID=A0A1M7U8H2_9ACTN|nr:alpha/beta hydrolase [Geodermatophilus obscurus]SHN79238.1 Pimeloyl-ACP methyl ester carboxylesterase [Geodermatophilus obscurus]